MSVGPSVGRFVGRSVFHAYDLVDRAHNGQMLNGRATNGGTRNAMVMC